MSSETICFEILRKLERLTAPRGTKVIITAHPDVADLLTDEESYAIEMIERRKGINIIIKEDSNIHQENYNITVL